MLVNFVCDAGNNGSLSTLSSNINISSDVNNISSTLWFGSNVLSGGGNTSSSLSISGSNKNNIS